MSSRKGITDEQIIEEFERWGSAKAAIRLDIKERGLLARRRIIEKRIGRALVPGVAEYQERSPTAKVRLQSEIKDGCVLIGSDCHYWSEVSTAHAAFLEFIREFKPQIIVLNGDVLDGQRISRHAPIGWEGTPSLAEELAYCQARLREIESAAPKGSRLVWPAGNHDLRFESRLADKASEYEGIYGTHLKDHFPKWEPCWSLFINENTVVKHRWKSGIHAVYNNTVNAGKTMVTGHLHSLKVVPFDDYNGTRWGVDCGTMAEPFGRQFEDYMEDNPRNWRSGFVMLTYKDYKLLWPEVIAVHAKGVVDFRGKLHNV